MSPDRAEVVTVAAPNSAATVHVAPRLGKGRWPTTVSASSSKLVAGHGEPLAHKA